MTVPSLYSLNISTSECFLAYSYPVSALITFGDGRTLVLVLQVTAHGAHTDDVRPAAAVSHAGPVAGPRYNLPSCRGKVTIREEGEF